MPSPTPCTYRPDNAMTPTMAPQAAPHTAPHAAPHKAPHSAPKTAPKTAPKQVPHHNPAAAPLPTPPRPSMPGEAKTAPTPSLADGPTAADGLADPSQAPALLDLLKATAPTPQPA